MKKLLLVSIFAACAIGVYAGSVNLSITGPTKVMPQVGQTRTNPVWAVDTAYSQGQYVYYRPFVYMCTVAGTSGSAVATSAPSLAGDNGTFTDTNGVTAWYRVGDTRRALILQSLTGSNVTWSFKGTNTTAQGVVTVAGGGLTLPIGSEQCWQGEVWATAPGAATVQATEF